MTRKQKFINWILSILFIAISVYFIGWRTDEVQGNLEASFIWAVPAFVASHAVLHRKIDRAVRKDDN